MKYGQPHFKFCDLERVCQGHDVQHSAMAPFDGKCKTFYVMVIVVFALSLTIYEIFTVQRKRLKFDLEMKVRVKEQKTGFVPFDWNC